MNRVFTIGFPDEETSEKFFNDRSYVEVRAKFFDKAVEHTTMIASYTS